MRSRPLLGYCTNVHAGATWEQAFANLDSCAPAVKSRAFPDRPMGLGLWLSAPAARRLRDDDAALARFRGWLEAGGLVPFTFNAFPYGDFHGEVVKHRVYHPTWWEPARLDYTRDVVALLDALLPPGRPGSLSTLPIAWGDPAPTALQRAEAGRALRTIAEELKELHEAEGRHIRLCLEPEPGCYLQYGAEVVDFFARELGDSPAVRGHLGVCHDTCHAAVMFEDQGEVLAAYRDAGIAVGKVQVSSAIRIDWEALDAKARDGAREQLAGFAEDRYLHQVLVRRPDGSIQEHDDLPTALVGPIAGEWRIHFHVPIYLERFGRLETTRDQIGPCLDLVDEWWPEAQIESETYAWGVLPESLRVPDLAEGIARELAWLEESRKSP